MKDFQTASYTINQEKRKNLVEPEEDGRIHSEIICPDGGTSLEALIQVAESKEQ
jgi:hypothetical protein